MLDIVAKLLLNSFMPAMLIEVLLADQLILLFVALTLADGHKVRGKQNLLI